MSAFEHFELMSSDQIDTRRQEYELDLEVTSKGEYKAKAKKNLDKMLEAIKNYNLFMDYYKLILECDPCNADKLSSIQDAQEKSFASAKKYQKRAVTFEKSSTSEVKDLSSPLPSSSSSSESTPGVAALISGSAASTIGADASTCGAAASSRGSAASYTLTEASKIDPNPKRSRLVGIIQKKWKKYFPGK